jgi:LAO/AO transport system kinase
MELADLVVVNKADGDLEPAARRAQGEYKAALHLMRPQSPHWSPPVLLASALKKKGLPEIWAAIGAYRQALAPARELDKKRAEQAKAWMWSEIHDGLMDAFAASNPGHVKDFEAKVVAGELPPTAAARALLAAFLKNA